MMFRLALIAVAAAAVMAQAPRASKYSDSPQFASILNEQRYLSGDGTFGAAYQQEDGIDFKEESDAEGNRKGSYSYIDPTGARRTVTYTAGKNGFQATGDHLPVAPAPIQEPQPQYNQQPQQRYNPQPQYNSVAPRQYNSAEDDGQYRPELYETDYVSAPQPNRNQLVTSPPFKQSYPQPQYSGVQQPQPQYSGVQQPQPQPQYTSYNPPQAARQNYFPVDQTTPAPHRFFPPGQFDLNRSPDGFTYTFRKA